MGLGWPLAAILAGFAAGALAAHQLQVRGLWATAPVGSRPVAALGVFERAGIGRSGRARGLVDGQGGRAHRGFAPGRSARAGPRS